MRSGKKWKDLQVLKGCCSLITKYAIFLFLSLDIHFFLAEIVLQLTTSSSLFYYSIVEVCYPVSTVH